MQRHPAQAAGLVTNQLLEASGTSVMRSGADVGRNREVRRRQRLWRRYESRDWAIRVIWSLSVASVDYR